VISLFLSSDSENHRDPLSGFWYGPVGRQSAAGIDVTPDVAMTYSAVWACTRVLCAPGASLPFNLNRRTNEGAEVDSNHSVHGLIHNLPNPEMTSMPFRCLGINRQVNNGNFWSEIERDRSGNPVRLWPIHNGRVKLFRASEEYATQAGVEPNSIVWRVQNDVGHDPSWIPDKDMFHVRSIISDDGIIGKGVIENARETIGHGLATVRQGAAYMKNSARPSVVIIGGKFKQGESREDYRRMWNDVHGGPANNAKPAMLPEGSDIKVLSFSPEDSQFIQTLQHSVEEVARWYGVPPHMIQHLLRATFDNIEHQGIDYVVYSLIPWLKLWEEEAWRKLLTPAEQKTHFFKHNVEGLLRGDAAARAAFYKAMWDIGAFSINDILRKEDMNSIGPAGDQHFVQTSYSTLEKLMSGIPEWQKAREKNDVTRDEYRTKILNLPATNDSDDAPLLALVGGLTGSAEIAKAVGRGEMTSAAAAELLQLFLRIEAEKAATIAGERVEPADPVATPAPFVEPVEDDTQAAVLASVKELQESFAKKADAVASRWLRESYSRMIFKEANDAKRAAKKPSGFLAWMDEYYATYGGLLREAVIEPLSVLGINPDQFTAQHIEQSRVELLAASDGDPDTFVSRVEAACGKWSERINTGVAI
jgi:HK97 family phage portal protein